MASFPRRKAVPIWATLLVLLSCSSAQLSDENFYSESCPNLLPTVKDVVGRAIQKEARMGASLLRLHFHDCFVNGCDGSVLLDDTPTFTGEKTAGPNNNSIRGFEVVDQIKSAVEKNCPSMVSCADILAIAARDSVEILGGPKWKVNLGRRDARNASLTAANQSLPSPLSNLSGLITNFQKHNLTVRDLVALSGAHTIGQAKCSSFRARIYNDSNVDGSFAQMRRANCSAAAGSTDNNLAPLDIGTPTTFDHHYYVDLLYKKGLLHSDQELYKNHNVTMDSVRRYTSSTRSFYEDFAKSMVKMGNIKPLTGSNGEIRKNCRAVNH